MIYTIRTTVGRENAVIETLNNKIKNMQADIKSLLHPDELKGYVFVEGDITAVEKVIQGVPHIRGIIRKQASLNDVKRFLEVKAVVVKVNKGDIIEITGGPFKNEKGKVTRVDESKEEVTIELLDAAVSIPITVAMDSVKIIEFAEKPKEEVK